MMKRYQVREGILSGPGCDETEDSDCETAIKDATPASIEAILRLLQRAYEAGRSDARQEVRDALGITPPA